MTSSRTYRKAQSVEVTIAELRRCSGTQFDPQLAELFLQSDVHNVSQQMARSGRTDSPITASEINA